MKRILHIVSSLNVNSGMMSVVMNYYRHIERKKIQFDFLYLFEMENTYKEEIEKFGGKCYYIGNPKSICNYMREINNFFCTHKDEYDAIHCHPIYSSIMFGFFAKKNGIKRVVAHSHSTQYSDKKISKIRNKLLINFITFFATDYVACTEEAASLFGKRVNRKKKILILKNAIELDKYKFNIDYRKQIRKELNIDSMMEVLCHVGRFSSEKNQKFILDIFNYYHKEHPNSTLIMVGDGALKQEIMKYGESLGIDNYIVYTGKRKDVNKILSAADAFLLPSLFEGAPVSAIEAQTSGLDCYLSDTITRDVNIVNCKYLDVNLPIGRWVDSLNCSLNVKKRERAFQILKESDYNIEKEVKILERFYLNL